MTGNGNHAADYDVVVIGGGVAGSSTARLIRRFHPGARILVVESGDRFGRKVGEATVELSGMFLSRVMGAWDILARDHLPKHGLRYWFADGPNRSLQEMTEIGPRAVSSLPSFQLDRSRLDEALLQCAAREGIELRRPARVGDVAIDRPHSRVEVLDGDGAQWVSARWVVDASGRRARLAHKLDLHRRLDDHPTAAVWARFRGVKDMDGADVTGADPRMPKLTQLAAARRLATNHFCGYGWWCWVIPLAGGETSIGLVYDKRYFRWSSEGKLRDRFRHFLTTRISGLKDLLEGAEMDHDDFHAYTELPYRATRYAGPGWALVGDAGGFIDPYYSPGLDHAAFTAYATSRLIAKDLAGELSPAALQERIDRHNGRFERSYDRWFDGLYRDKYEILGDAELVASSFLFETGMYYLGIVGPVWKELDSLEIPTFGYEKKQAEVAYKMMRFFRRRMVRLARFRRATGTYGRRNLGWKWYLTRFELGGRALGMVRRGAALWLAAEWHYLLYRLRHGSVNVSAPVPEAVDANPPA